MHAHVACQSGYSIRYVCMYEVYESSVSERVCLKMLISNIVVQQFCRFLQVTGNA
jgi:hypothetical protein